MAQLRRDYKEFTDKDVEILVIGPENAKKFADYKADLAKKVTQRSKKLTDKIANKED